MSLASRIIGRLAQLPPAETYRVTKVKDIPVPMKDGVNLLGDHYAPEGLGRRPTVLVRTPYGRAGYIGILFGYIFAERGFHVFIQSCRGTFGSGGALEPFRHEREDGLDTVAWLKEQDWFNGQLATAGQSYLGMTQWCMAADLGKEYQAMSTWISSAETRTLTYPGESFFLEALLSWAATMDTIENTRGGLIGQLLARVMGNSHLDKAYLHLPLNEADRVATGRTVEFYQDWLAHNQPANEHWAAVNYAKRVSEITTPNHIIGGWYDIFLPQTIRDYTTLRDAGRNPYLTIGPWAHTDMGLTTNALRETITWFRAILLDEPDDLRKQPVRVYVMGADEWRDLPAWPPAGYAPQQWYLHPEGKLATTPPPDSEPDRYLYDPGDPTPNIGGAVLMNPVKGAQDNRKLEARPDVLTFTTNPFTTHLEIMGPVTAELFVHSSRPYTDFFVRLCAVDPAGKSTNIADGILRLEPGRPDPAPDGCQHITIDLGSTAYCFRPGHCLRIQVSSGAFPRFARNPGSGEPLGTAKLLYPAAQRVFHDPAHPSALNVHVTQQ